MTDPTPLLHWTVVLCRTQGPVNLGMIMRLCGNVGINDLRLVDPLCSGADDDARRFANHARERLAAIPIYGSLSDAIADSQLAIATTARVRDARFGSPLALTEMSAAISERKASRVALVFGNEADGLTNDELALCPLHLHLDTPGDYPSYNLAHAVAIVSHFACCLMEQTTVQSTDQQSAAPIALQKKLETYWLDSLERVDYFRGNRSREQFAPHFAQLIHRLALSNEDATVLLGCLAQGNYFAFQDKFLGDGSQDSAK